MNAIEETDRFDETTGGFSFANISEENKINQNFSRLAPEWRQVDHGFNLEGKCRHRGCKAYGNRVIIPVGEKNSKDGTNFFHIPEIISDERFQRCPMSPVDKNAPGYHLIEEKDLNNVCLVRCHYRIEYQFDEPQCRPEMIQDRTQLDTVTWDVVTSKLARYRFLKFTVIKLLD